jgi:hypothetical protein
MSDTVWLQARKDPQGRERRTCYLEGGGYFVATLDTTSTPRWHLQEYDANGVMIPVTGRWYVSLDACTQAVDAAEEVAPRDAVRRHRRAHRLG